MTKKDFTQTAFDIFQQAIGDKEKPQQPSEHKANSSKGGKIGGFSRAKRLTEEERIAQAMKSAEKKKKK